jgi:long-chain fatty acid transport protein
VSLAVTAALTAPASALATNGYFTHGWGTKAKAMAGATTALPQDTLVTATNPAGMGFIGTSLDLGVAFFSPSDRGYEANSDFAVDPDTGFPAGPFVTPGRYVSDRDWFLVPSFGYNRVLNDRMTIGIALFGNGGMNTRYKDRPVWENFAAAPDQVAVGPFPAPPGTIKGPPPFGLLFTPTNPPMPVTAPGLPPEQGNANPGGVLTATTPTGVNLEQLFIEIPFTYKLNEAHVLGIAPVFAVQSFEAEGLQPFRAASQHFDKVTNNDRDWSYGFGLHLGWVGRINDQLSLGASYRTRTWMTEFDEYKGLFAEEGDFDIPAMLNLGVAFKPVRNLTLALDWQHIFYGDIDAIANSNNVDIAPCFQNPTLDFCLGGDDGLGFGWDDMDVFKVGALWDYSDKWSFRGGVSYASDFAPSGQALFNVMAPATIKWHFTLGATYRHSASDEFSLSLAYMPEEELKGRNENITGSQTGSVFMEQKEIELSWTHRF